MTDFDPFLYKVQDGGKRSGSDGGLYLTPEGDFRGVEMKSYVDNLGKTIYIPGLNIPIQLNEDITQRASQIPFSLFLYTSSRLDKEIPDSFSWRDVPGTRVPLNQKNCGSCWALSTSIVLGDVISISTRFTDLPVISATNIMSCLKQGHYGCRGGSTSKAILDLQDVGVFTRECTDYSWCDDNIRCNGSALEHLNNPNEDYLNSKIPPCGVCKRNGKYTKYFIKNVYTHSAETPEDVNRIQKNVKMHIMSRGPVVGAFHILLNFVKTNTGFRETGGIYLESFNYRLQEGSDERLDISQPGVWSQRNKYFSREGSHAVVVVGWGETSDKLINPDTGKPVVNPVTGMEYGRVGYWIVKNSWSTDWADGGYFKMAMYPHNKISQFEMSVPLIDEFNVNARYKTGGFTSFEYRGKEEVEVDSEWERAIDQWDIIPSTIDKDSFVIPFVDPQRDETQKDEQSISLKEPVAVDDTIGTENVIFIDNVESGSVAVDDTIIHISPNQTTHNTTEKGPFPFVFTVLIIVIFALLVGVGAYIALTRQRVTRQRVNSESSYSQLEI